MAFNFDNIDEDLSDNEDEGFMFGGNDGTIFVIDAAPEMHESNDGEDSHFVKAFKCAHSTLCRKIISQDKDLTAIVLYNTRETKSHFPGIYVLQDLDRAGAERVMEIEKVMEAYDQFDTKFGSSSASLVDVLGNCINLFQKCTRKLQAMSVFLFTSNDSPNNNDQHMKRQIEKKVQDLNENNIDFEVLHMGDSFDINKFYKELLVSDDNEESAVSYTLSDPSVRIEELMDRVRRVNHQQRSTGKVNFSLGPDMEFGVQFYTTIRKTTKPTRVKLFKTTNEEVIVKRKQFLQESGRLLLQSDFVKVQNYGGRDIVFSNEEVKGLKKVYNPGIHLLGFKPISSIKPHLYLKPAHFIYCDESSIQGSNKIFAALLERCLARQVVPIARVVPRKNASISWAALIPQEEEMDEKNCQITPPGFQVTYLPFADDIRSFDIEKSEVASTDQIEAMKDVMKKMTFKYHPDCFENPDLQTHWRNLEVLALKRSEIEPVVDYTVPDYDRIKRKVGDLIDEFKSKVFDDGYNPEAKMPASRSSAPKKPKIDISSMAVPDIAKAGCIDKLTVAKLKDWLEGEGLYAKGKKKPELVQDVYDHLGISN